MMKKLILIISIITTVEYFYSVYSLSSPSISTSIDNVYRLPPKLNKYVEGLRNVPDERLRYQQLLFLASKCPPMDATLKTDSNKVPGCLSTVHVHANCIADKIYFIGDSDAQLTKGLVAMLVNGISGHSNQEIQDIQPEFINYAGITNSLTPGRNNGFLNMLKLMKDKARAVTTKDNASSSPNALESSVKEYGVIYKSMTTKLSMLKPTELVIIDESAKHAGHAGNSGDGKETHFNVKIIAPCFQGLSLVQRHRMIYTLLGEEINTSIHALSIVAKTPDE